MLLDLSEIVIREGMRSSIAVDQPGVEDPDLEFVEPLRGRLSFANGGDVISIGGKVNTAVRASCSRCLAEVNVPVTLEVDEHFPIDDVLHPNRQPREGEEYDPQVSSVVHLDQGRPMLDLDEFMRQLVVAEIPIRSLCSEACAGLCPRCGANRNEGPCACVEEPANTPLSGLRALLKDQDGQ
jgi:uncharacterized protein